MKKKTLILTNSLQMSKAIRASGLLDQPDVEELCTASHLLDEGQLFPLADANVYLQRQVPRNRRGRPLWRTQDLPIIPEKWRRFVRPSSECLLKVAREKIRRAQRIIHAGTPNRRGQLAIDLLLESSGRSPEDVHRLWVDEGIMPPPEAVLKAMDELLWNDAGVGLRLAGDAEEKANWLTRENLTRAWTLANLAAGTCTHLFRMGRASLPLLADTVFEGRGVIELPSLQASVTDPAAKATWDNAAELIFGGWAWRQGRRLAATQIGVSLAWTLGPEHELFAVPREDETALKLIESGLIKPAQWLEEVIEWVTEQVKEARPLGLSSPMKAYAGLDARPAVSGR